MRRVWGRGLQHVPEAQRGNAKDSAFQTQASATKCPNGSHYPHLQVWFGQREQEPYIPNLLGQCKIRQVGAVPKCMLCCIALPAANGAG